MHIVSTAPSLLVVTFRLAEDEFALGAERVLDTLMNACPTRVPGAADGYDGILSWRGQIVPVLNVARRLGLPGGAGAAVVMIEAEGEWVGLRVDALLEEQPIALEALELPADPLGCAAGVGLLRDRRVVLLDPTALLSASGGAVSAFLSKPERSSGRPAGNGRRGVKRA